MCWRFAPPTSALALSWNAQRNKARMGKYLVLIEALLQGYG
ncbi:hypothetical protein [Lactococcus lactis]|nr:hypothetical protein [Lactococcus lactis]